MDTYLRTRGGNVQIRLPISAPMYRRAIAGTVALIWLLGASSTLLPTMLGASDVAAALLLLAVFTVAVAIVVLGSYPGRWVTLVSEVQLEQLAAAGGDKDYVFDRLAARALHAAAVLGSGVLGRVRPAEVSAAMGVSEAGVDIDWLLWATHGVPVPSDATIDPDGPYPLPEA